MIRAAVEIYWAFKGENNFSRTCQYSNLRNFCLPSYSQFIKANRTEHHWGRPSVRLSWSLSKHGSKITTQRVCVCVCVYIQKEWNRTANQERLFWDVFVKGLINRNVWPVMRRENGITCLLVAEALEILATTEIYTYT